MDDNFSARLIDSPVFRSIPTIAASQDLFDDLSEDDDDMRYAIALESSTKPGPVSIGSPIIHRPFDEADWYSLIGYPFESLGASRLSTGDYGVWYGAMQAETALSESLFYVTRRFLDDRLDGLRPTRVDRRVYMVNLCRTLVDVTKPPSQAAKFSDPNNWSFAQVMSGRLQASGAQGVYYRSARCDGQNVGLFTPEGLSDPRELFNVAFTWSDDEVIVTRGDSVIMRASA